MLLEGGGQMLQTDFKASTVSVAVHHMINVSRHFPSLIKHLKDSAASEDQLSEDFPALILSRKSSDLFHSSFFLGGKTF